MISGCRGQVRAGFGGAYGLDFNAVFELGRALGADLRFLAEVLPMVEPLMIRNETSEGEDHDHADEVHRPPPQS